MLFSLSARRLARRCQRILLGDTLWPPYRRRLLAACREEQTPVVVCSLRDLVRRVGCADEAITHAVTTLASQEQCDGLALPLVDHFGTRLPVKRITRKLRGEGVPLRVLLDASQAVGHVPLVLRGGWCDALVAGTHKWLGAGQPLGFAITEPSLVGQGGNLSRTVDDPLRRFTDELCGGASSSWGETAGILPLLTAAGAVADCSAGDVRDRVTARIDAKLRLAAKLREHGWGVRAETEGSATGMLVAKSPSGRRGADCLRRGLRRHRIVATVYPRSVVRFSMPSRGLTTPDHHRIEGWLQDTTVAVSSSPTR